MANQIHPTAIIDPEAKLGDGNVIGPFCVIDKNVIIGDNNTLLNSVTIHYGARIGNGNEFFPGASISTKPQDLKFQGEETTCELLGGGHVCLRRREPCLQRLCDRRFL